MAESTKSSEDRSHSIGQMITDYTKKSTSAYKTNYSDLFLSHSFLHAALLHLISGFLLFILLFLPSKEKQMYQQS